MYPERMKTGTLFWDISKDHYEEYIKMADLCSASDL